MAWGGAAWMMDSNERFVEFLKSGNVEENCNIYCISYLAIYRLFNVKQLKQDMKSRCNPHLL